jgi:hypothetical protein
MRHSPAMGFGKLLHGKPRIDALLSPCFRTFRERELFCSFLHSNSSLMNQNVFNGLRVTKMSYSIQKRLYAKEVENDGR